MATSSADANLEHRFSKELIRFVLHENMVGLNWIPTGIFADKEIDSPFTPQFRNSLVNQLDNQGYAFHEAYDMYFPDKSKIEESHFDVCKTKKDAFIGSEFTKENFLIFCATSAQFAGLSYLYGAKNAPYETYLIISTALRELKNIGKIGAAFWKEIGWEISEESENV